MNIRVLKSGEYITLLRDDSNEVFTLARDDLVQVCREVFNGGTKLLKRPVDESPKEFETPIEQEESSVGGVGFPLAPKIVRPDIRPVIPPKPKQDRPADCLERVKNVLNNTTDLTAQEVAEEADAPLYVVQQTLAQMSNQNGKSKSVRDVYKHKQRFTPLETAPGSSDLPVKKAPAWPMRVTDTTNNAVLGCIKAVDGRITAPEICKVIGRSYNTVGVCLRQLLENSVINRTGDPRNGYSYSYGKAIKPEAIPDPPAAKKPGPTNASEARKKEIVDFIKSSGGNTGVKEICDGIGRSYWGTCDYVRQLFKAGLINRSEYHKVGGYKYTCGTPADPEPKQELPAIVPAPCVRALSPRTKTETTPEPPTAKKWGKKNYAVKVFEVLKNAKEPMTAGEIAGACGIVTALANPPLSSLLVHGKIEKSRIPEHRKGPGKKSGRPRYWFYIKGTKPIEEKEAREEPDLDQAPDDSGIIPGGKGESYRESRGDEPMTDSTGRKVDDNGQGYRDQNRTKRFVNQRPSVESVVFKHIKDARPGATVNEIVNAKLLTAHQVEEAIEELKSARRIRKIDKIGPTPMYGLRI